MNKKTKIVCTKSMFRRHPVSFVTFSISVMICLFLIYRRYIRLHPIDTVFQPIKIWIPHFIWTQQSTWNLDPRILFASQIIDFKMIRKRKLDMNHIQTYWIYFLDLWKASTKTLPSFIVFVPSPQIILKSARWNYFLSKLPKRIEAIVLVDQYTVKNIRPTRKWRTYVPSILKPISDFQKEHAIVIFRTSSFQKKLFRLLPISEDFSKAFCAIFRTFVMHKHQDLFSPILIPRRTIITIPRTFCTFSLNNAMIDFDLKSLRGLLNISLSTYERQEYFAYVNILTQHHWRAEWILVHNVQWNNLEQFFPLIEKTLQYIPTEVDAFPLVYEWNDSQSGILSTVQMTLFRSKSIRDKIFCLFPILNPFATQLSLNWNILLLK